MVVFNGLVLFAIELEGDKFIVLNYQTKTSGVDTNNLSGNKSQGIVKFPRKYNMGNLLENNM